MPLNNFNYTLSWSDFTQTAASPGDENAQIHPDMTFADFQLTRNGNAVAVADVTINIRLIETDCWVVSGHLTADLLRHEQVHYDILALSAREFYKALKTTTARTTTELQTKVSQLKTRFGQQAAAKDASYDLQTNHGRNTTIQQTWETRTATAKQNPNGTINDLP